MTICKDLPDNFPLDQTSCSLTSTQQPLEAREALIQYDKRQEPVEWDNLNNGLTAAN